MNEDKFPLGTTIWQLLPEYSEKQTPRHPVVIFSHYRHENFITRAAMSYVGAVINENDNKQKMEQQRNYSNDIPQDSKVFVELP